MTYNDVLIQSNADWSLIPEHMRDSVRAYIEQRRHVGHFLTAVFSNDLKEAAARADEKNHAALADYVMFMYNYAPGMCWGSPERVEAWLAGRDE